MSSAEPAPAPQIRIDQLTGMRTIVAPGRADRPNAFAPTPDATEAEAKDRCPFCEGAEDMTPPEVWADRAAGGGADSPGWRVRSVPNLYPILAGPEAAGPGIAAEQRSAGPARGVEAAGDGRAAGRPGAAGPRAQESGFSSVADPLQQSRRSGELDLFRSLPAQGAHEVIVNSPSHETRLAALDEEQFGYAVRGWRDRIAAHADSAAYVHLIVNEGRLAGASLEHTHAQLYALPFVPAEVARERERFSAYSDRTMGGALLADVATEEVRRGDRLVAVDDDALLICPWASRTPYELRVIPRTPAARFELDGEVGTTMLRTALVALSRAFEHPPPLSLWVRTAPSGVQRFHWHVDIAPRLVIKAGFELGTG
ncbi:MAG: galactose-1-phosphate uridylyltransferase, partial [Solirubrobacterales bacterium]